MGDIIILSPDVVNKIAAGEVVERPASVVKELIDNSIDAGAGHIIIRIMEGGKSSIIVEDDGKGMKEEDALRSVLPHSTSKLHSAKDLHEIRTMGFRGEALSSIAAVSELTLITRRPEDESGLRLKYAGGNLIDSQETGARQGTRIEVVNLFFNTPARKKFLKGLEYERSKCIELVQTYSLAYPGIHFEMEAEGREIINYPKAHMLLTRVYQIYGREIARNMIDLDLEDPDMSIRGLISKPDISRSTKKDQYIFINHRPVVCPEINNAVNEAYSTMLFLDRKPLFFLDMMLDPKLIDVNVHPAKTEVRLSRVNELHDKVFAAVRVALTNNDLIPERDINEKQSYLKESDTRNKPKNNTDKKYSDTGASQSRLLNEKNQAYEGSRLPGMIFLGIINKTYILAETETGLLLIDQHAAAERIKYEEFISQVRDADVKVQGLLKPLIIDVDPATYALAGNIIQEMEIYGFRIELFGEGAVMVRAVPEIIGMMITKEDILDLIKEIGSAKRKQDISIDKNVDEYITYKACRSAIKAGDDLSFSQVKALMEKLESGEIPYTCPHGRPVFVRITYEEMEKMFRRR